MSVRQFFWNTWWREANATTRAIHLAAVVLPMTAGAAIELFTEDPSSFFIPLWVWPVIALVCGAITFFVGVTKRAMVLEREREPKISISDPQEYFMPWTKAQSGERVHHHYYITVTNISFDHIRHCSVEEASFTNNRGHEAPLKGRFFRLRSEGEADPIKHEYTRRFDLRGKGDHKEVDICSVNEGEVDSRIFMYYATTRTDQQKSSIDRSLFPHILRIQITADNLTVPETKTFRIFVNDRGDLGMESI